MRTVERCISAVLTVLVALTAMGASLLGTTRPASAATSGLPRTGALFGAAVSTRPGQDVRTGVTDLESHLGRRMDVHRLYDSWDDPQPNALAAWDATSGRTPVLSIKAQRHNGSVVPWASIAAGREDAAIRAQANGLKRLNVPLFLALHHEPENDARNGTPASYIGAWRHYVSVFRALHVTNVKFTWIMMASSFGQGARKAASYYPGDSYIDVVGGDGYNWYGTQPGKRWRSLADALAPFYAWGTAHHKPLMVAEWGTLEDRAVPGRKAQWLADAAASLKRMPAIKVVCYFHAPVVYPWWVDSSPSALRAFAAMGHDPYFRTAPGSH
jgi:hypothetical protein